MQTEPLSATLNLRSVNESELPWEFHYAGLVAYVSTCIVICTPLPHESTERLELLFITDLTGPLRELMPLSQIAYYDAGLDGLREETAETSADSQRVIYEDHKIDTLRKHALENTEFPVLSITIAKDLNSDCTSKQRVLVANGVIEMEGISKYSGVGGGLSQRQFKQDAEAVYDKMLRDPQEHLMIGFGQWEFIALLSARLVGEARTVHAFFMEMWDFEDRENPMYDEAEDVERRRQLWRMFRRDSAAFLTLRAQSRFVAVGIVVIWLSS